MLKTGPKVALSVWLKRSQPKTFTSADITKGAFLSFAASPSHQVLAVVRWQAWFFGRQRWADLRHVAVHLRIFHSAQNP
jgi:hypothetical protein